MSRGTDITVNPFSRTKTGPDVTLHLITYQNDKFRDIYSTDSNLAGRLTGIRFFVVLLRTTK